MVDVIHNFNYCVYDKSAILQLCYEIKVFLAISLVKKKAYLVCCRPHFGLCCSSKTDIQVAGRDN